MRLCTTFPLLKLPPDFVVLSFSSSSLPLKHVTLQYYVLSLDGAPVHLHPKNCKGRTGNEVPTGLD